MTLILTRSDLQSMLTPEDCLTSVEEAFRSYGEGRTGAPKSLGLHAPAGTYHVKAAMADVFVMKLNANFPDNRTRHELPRKVVVDILDQAATMGDLHHALEAGLLTREDVHGELADVICGRAAGRQTDDEVFVFDSTGTALQDVAVSSLAYARAARRGAGVEVAFTS
jgi:ornithine cyclodeaminase/alanine dehydrogenase-like protein (mu-crystallin family)